jgi:excisionase family DNA binding protein
MQSQFPPSNSIPQACAVTGLSRATLYARIKSGQLRVVKDGGRTFITGSELERYLRARETAGA